MMMEKTAMTKYIHNPIKPVEVEAYQIGSQYTISEARNKFPSWLLENSLLLVNNKDMVIGICLSTSTNKSYSRIAYCGDWIVKDENDRLHIYTNNNFNKAYSEVKSEVQLE